MTAKAGVFPTRHVHLVVWVYPADFYDVTFTLSRLKSLELYDCTLNYIFQKNVFIQLQ